MSDSDAPAPGDPAAPVGDPPPLRTGDLAAVDVLPDGVVIADADARVLLVNRAAERQLGVDRDAVLGRPLAEVLMLRDQGGSAWYDVNRPYQGLQTRTGVPEQPWVLPDGSEVLVTARLHRADRSAPVDLVAVSLRSGRGRARLDRERSDLVATVAHELRSPVTGVKGFVQALLSRWDRLTDEQKLFMLRTVGADAERLTALIAELLDVARIDTGRLSLYPEPADLAELLARVVASVQAGTAREIVLDVATDLPLVRVDPGKLTQVVTNLVENSVRHGDGTVRVAARPATADGEYAQVVLTVDDQGSGIPPEIRRRVFTKYWRFGSRAGTGLGMYLVNGLVRAHGGTVTLGDSPDGGARVTVLLPVDDHAPQ